MHFNGQVVLVTGAAGGIGRPLSFCLGRAGATLALLDRDGDKLDAMAQELSAEGIRCAIAVADVGQRAQMHCAIETLTAELGPVDVLVTAAGICDISTEDDLRVERLEQVLQINFLGTVYAIEAVLPSMLQRQRGQIAGIASMTAIRAIPFESAYCASKAAVAYYLESMRPTLRTRGVKVTTIYPGFVKTPLLDALLETTGSAMPAGVVTPEVAAQKIARGIYRAGPTVSFPWSTTWLMMLVKWLPPRVYDIVMRRVAASIPMKPAVNYRTDAVVGDVVAAGETIPSAVSQR